MAKVKVVLNRKNVRTQLLESPEMKKICTKLAKQAVSSLGKGYDTITYAGKDRVKSSIKAMSGEAQRDNMEHNTILKALGGVGK